MMKVFSLIPVILAVTTLFTQPVLAGDDAAEWTTPKYYVQLGLASSFTNDQDFDKSIVGSGTYKPDWGIGAGGEVGVFLNDTWRFGVGLVWLRGFDGKVDFDDPALASTKLNKSADAITMLFNAYYYFGEMQGLFAPINPFIGAGIGFTHFDIGDKSGSPGGNGTSDPTDTVLSGALRIGWDTKLRPGVTLTSSYALGFTDRAKFQTLFGVDTEREASVDFGGFIGLRFDLN